MLYSNSICQGEWTIAYRVIFRNANSAQGRGVRWLAQWYSAYQHYISGEESTENEAALLRLEGFP